MLAEEEAELQKVFHSEFLVDWVISKAVVLVVYVEYGITIIEQLVIVEINFARYGLKMLLIQVAFVAKSFDGAMELFVSYTI